MTKEIISFEKITPGLFVNTALHLSVAAETLQLEVEPPAVARQVFSVAYNPDLSEALLRDVAQYDDPIGSRKAIRSDASRNLLHFSFAVIPDRDSTILEYNDRIVNVQSQLRRLSDAIKKTEEQAARILRQCIELCFNMPSTAEGLRWGKCKITLWMSPELANLLKFSDDLSTVRARSVLVGSKEVC